MHTILRQHINGRLLTCDIFGRPVSAASPFTAANPGLLNGSTKRSESPDEANRLIEERHMKWNWNDVLGIKDNLKNRRYYFFHFLSLSFT